MDGMPPVRLGAVIAIPFLAAYLFRIPLERRLVSAAPPPNRPGRQFSLELGLCALAGLIAGGYNHIVNGFPVFSGMKLFVGCLILGFFLGMDSALARERRVIQGAIDSKSAVSAPSELHPVTRRFSLLAFAAIAFVTIVLTLVISHDIAWLVQIDPDAISRMRAQKSVIYELLFVMAVLLAFLVNLIVSYSRNLKLLFRNQIQVLDRVSRGDLSQMAPVATSDEFGFIAGYTNDMIAGLRHRTKLIAALKVAEEIQQTLLPQKAPTIPGVDLSGKSVYCYETGGDYFDYLRLPDGRLGVVAADASDHGVGSSLYMATVRAFLRFGARTFTSAAALLNEVNRYLAHDSAESGRFVSVFFLEVDAATRSLRWIRAGHEPGILYDPAADRFESLNGKGVALGVMETLDLEENGISAPTPGTIVALTTDGVRETRNSDNEFFGLQRLQSAIREHSGGSAAEIRDAVLARLDAFRGKAPMEDDVTLVLLKLA